MSGVPAAFVTTPGKISNRAFIKAMERWGWKQKKVSGDDTVMESPAGWKITVRSENCHQGNSRYVIQSVLDFMGIGWNDFLTLPDQIDSARNMAKALQHVKDEAALEQFKDFLVAEMVSASEELTRKREEQSRRDREANEKRKAAQKEAKAVTAQPAAVPQVSFGVGTPAATPPPTGGPGRATGAANKVFDYLIRHQGPHTTSRIAGEVGLTQSQASNACLYLYRELGIIERVKHGVYQSKREYTANDMRIDLVQRTLTTIAPTLVPSTPAAKQEPEQEAPKPAPAPEAPATPVRAAMARVATSSPEALDETLNEVLDLIFPNGFKARHLATIERWKDITRLLMKEVGNDG